MTRVAFMLGIISAMPWILLLLLLLPHSIHANRNHHYNNNNNNNNNNKKSTNNISKKLNKQVEDLYVKAEQLQDRAFARVYELQHKAQQLQDRAFKRSQQLEQQSQSILEKATQQAKSLQSEAAHNLGEIKSVIEGLQIPTTTTTNSGTSEKDDTKALMDADVEIDLGDGLSVEVPVVQESTVEQEDPPPQKVVIVKNKMQNVKERLLPAILMLGGLAAYVKFGGSFIPLVFMIQFGLFAETTAVANINTKQKWWWFLTAVAATNGHLLGWPHVDSIAYGMSVLGLVAWVIQQNEAKVGAVLVFRRNLASLAATALSLLILVGQSSFWIATLQDYGVEWILYPALLVIVNDTMAYVFGMLLGKHPLLPIISPKKTWEGFIGATISTLGISYPLLQKLIPTTTSNAWMHAMAIGTFVSLVSPFGGFLASIVKRAHDKKDFANWIQGHGGTVDRLDCQVITAPFVYYYLTTFVKAATTSSGG